MDETQKDLPQTSENKVTAYILTCNLNIIILVKLFLYKLQKGYGHGQGTSISAPLIIQSWSHRLLIKQIWAPHKYLSVQRYRSRLDRSYEICPIYL